MNIKSKIWHWSLTGPSQARARVTLAYIAACRYQVSDIATVSQQTSAWRSLQAGSERLDCWDYAHLDFMPLVFMLIGT